MQYLNCTILNNVTSSSGTSTSLTLISAKSNCEILKYNIKIAQHENSGTSSTILK